MIGIAEAHNSGDDVEMTDENMKSMINKGSKKLIVGSAELNFKRDRMEIVPLYQENGISTNIQ